MKTTRCLSLFLLSGILALFAAMATAADEPTVSLDFIDFKKLSNDAVEIRIALSADAPQTTDFTSDNPTKISLDLPGVSNNLPWSLPLPVGIGVTKNVKAVQAKGRTRVVVNVDKLVTYELRTEGKNIFLTVGENVPAEQVAVTDTAAPEPEPAPPPVSKPTPIERASGNGATISLKNVSFTSLPGDSVQIRLSFSGPAKAPGNFTINNPARIVLDFPKTGSKLGWKNKNIGIGFAKSVTAVEAGDRTRIILNLVQLIPFESEVSGNNVVVTLAGSRTAQTQATAAVSNKATSAALSATSGLHRINNIDFRRGKNGEGKIIVGLSDNNTPISTGESGNQIFVEFGDTGLPKNLQQRLDVIDFATPVQYIDATQSGDRVRLAITPTGNYEYLAYHTGDSYTIEVKEIPKEKVAAARKDQFGYTGERLSLNFQDIEVRAVLQLIADFTNLNMVTSDSVQGNLTLRLKNVPWDQALDLILKTKGLAMRKAGNVIMVAPAQEIAAQEKLELEANKQIEELAPIKTEIIQINFAKAGDIASILSAEGGTLSERGSATIDQRTNTLLLSDTADRLDSARELIVVLDIPIRQVMIEARIVIADDDFAKDLGVRFGVTSVNDRSGDLLFGSGSLDATDTMAASALDNLANGTPNAPYPIEIPMGAGGIPQRMNVNMPVVGNNAGRIALSILGANTLLDLELSALQLESRGEVVSNPRVITANQKEALIEQGTEIPYQRAASSGATAVSFKKAVLSLKVTPQITPDDRIILDLKVNKDSVGVLFAGIPSIDTKEIETQVLMNNGETVVLGGVYEQVTRNERDSIPFLGDLPFIGALFRTTRERNEKSELLIFVTPKILKDQFAVKP
ncbi:MAG: type IV pilus secretin PilQ [Gammaproteobacteria bacterium]|nr:type IV pilus secretin PilQ [Gammaproteobacteria bacterium]MCF6261352.1 type IV pilus secretin PilQ [Gammaproteobacteria bacterium]